MAKKISFGGMCAALSAICLILENVFITNKIFLTCLATLFVPLCTLMCGIPFGAASWIVSSVIAFFVLPYKMLSFLYVILAGYTLMKYFIEKIGVLWKEWAFKILFYAVTAFIAFLYLHNITVIFYLIGACFLLFVFYDIVLSIGITFLKKRLTKYM